MAVKTRGYAHRVDLAAPPSRVWSALIEPALLSRWHGPNAVVKPKAGGRFSGTLDPGIEREATIDIFEPNAATCMQALTRLLDSTQKSRIIFEPVVEPIILGFEPDQHACWLPVARDHDFMRLSLPEISR